MDQRRQRFNRDRVGLRGSGKCSVGQPMANAVGYGFVDADRLMEQAAGRSTPAIFASEGEEGFRAAAGRVVMAEGVEGIEGEDDEVVAMGIFAEGAGGSGAGFLMGSLAMDDGSVAAFGVVAHAAPDAHDIAAGGVDGGAAAGRDLFHDCGFRAEGRDDDDVFRVE